MTVADLKADLKAAIMERDVAWKAAETIAKKYDELEAQCAALHEAWKGYPWSGETLPQVKARFEKAAAVEAGKQLLERLDRAEVALAKLNATTLHEDRIRTRAQDFEDAAKFWDDTEARSAEAHAVYQKEAHRRGDVRHPDAYADLSEATKEWDRVLVRWVAAAIRKLKDVQPKQEDANAKQVREAAPPHGVCEAQPGKGEGRGN